MLRTSILLSKQIFSDPPKFYLKFAERPDLKGNTYLDLLFLCSFKTKSFYKGKASISKDTRIVFDPKRSPGFFRDEKTNNYEIVLNSFGWYGDMIKADNSDRYLSLDKHEEMTGTISCLVYCHGKSAILKGFTELSKDMINNKICHDSDNITFGWTTGDEDNIEIDID